jgi:uncharacterized damage-inducible protein DinB
MTDDLASLHEFNRWADARVVQSLRALDDDEYTRELGGGWPSVRATFVHLAGATWAWSERIAGRDCTVLHTAEQLPRLDDAASLLEEAHGRFVAIVADASPERLAAPFTWKNLAGAERTADFWVILRHVVNHASYHRGQISSMVKRLGKKPIATDMVLWGIERHEQR